MEELVQQPMRRILSGSMQSMGRSSSWQAARSSMSRRAVRSCNSPRRDRKEEKRKRKRKKETKLEEERRLREEAKRNKTNPTAQEVVLHRRVGSLVVTRVRSPGVNLLRSPLGALARATALKRGMSSTTTMSVPPLAKRAKSRTSPWSESQRTPCYTMSFPSPVRSLEGIPSTARSPPPPDASRSTSSRGSDYPTSNLYFHEIWNVKLMLQKEDSNEKPVIKSMVHAMQEKFNKYWSESYLTTCILVILDPRFKYEYIEFRLKKAFGNAAKEPRCKIKNAIRGLFDEYSGQIGVSPTELAQEVNGENVGENNPFSDWHMHLSVQR